MGVIFAVLVAVVGTVSCPAFSAEAPVNLPLPTLGGKQFWADEFVQTGWRIQKNVVTGHYRLLDPRNIRRAWGSYEQCRADFEGWRQTLNMRSPRRHMVILVHGLGRSAGMFDDLMESLSDDGYEAVSINYASTWEDIAAHAGHLRRLIANLDGVDEVSFVTHSMGALVVRSLLAEASLELTAEKFGRLVMIAPPNQGSAVAKALNNAAAFQPLIPESGRGLTPGAARAIPVPAIPFAIIAGGRGDGTGFNPFLEGDDDGVVTVAEAALPGARDFLVVPSPHGFVDNHPMTIAAVRSFLKHGQFRLPENDATLFEPPKKAKNLKEDPCN